MSVKNLLVELLVEELPPKSLKELGENFAAVLFASLKDQDLASSAAVMTAYATPRRLAVHVTDVTEQAADKSVSQKLMPVAVGLDANGQATPALLKKLASFGADVSVVPQLKRAMDGKTETLFFDNVVKGVTLAEGLQMAIDVAIAKLPIAKVMTYQLADGWSSVRFVRPAHGLVALHGTDVVPVKVLGLEARNTTQGHRFMSSGMIRIREADSYAEQLLNEGKVIANFAERRASIVKQLELFKVSKESDEIIRPDALLDEVTALVEWPKVYECHFDHEFLSVPQECLILTMQTNQKYFPCTLNGVLRNRFLVVSNVETAEPASIVGGNERVVRPRLADAKFFFDQDRRKTLGSHVKSLDKVMYHNKLGTQGARMQRVSAIAKAIGEQLGGETLATLAGETARLAKADLLTDMVGEFPELQGIMGRYYAQHDGLSDEIAFAIEDHYKPRFAGDILPRNMVGICVALADKLETLVGMFGIGQMPTGDKDPFALRRHALGVVRILIERDLPIGVRRLIDITQEAMPGNVRGNWVEPLDFILHRASGYFEERGFPARAVRSVLLPFGAASPLGQLLSIVEAASVFIASPEGQYLAEANKRITNILKKSGFEVPFRMSPEDLPEAPNAALFRQDEERSLFSSLLAAGDKSLKLREEKRFAEALSALAPLSQPTKAFFDKVMVNVDEPEIRDNRITLLQHARAYMNQVADLSLMAE
ncbi:MAG TPA: glycine--tRNA ligase subunit beta [Gallionella sp.]|nr:glycine--tRNA ligase subunit beta [Gallionella sp.]